MDLKDLAKKGLKIVQKHLHQNKERKRDCLRTSLTHQHNKNGLLDAFLQKDKSKKDKSQVVCWSLKKEHRYFELHFQILSDCISFDLFPHLSTIADKCMSKKYFAKWNWYLLQMINCLDIFLTTINPAIKQQRWNGKCSISLIKRKTNMGWLWKSYSRSPGIFVGCGSNFHILAKKKVWKLDSQVPTFSYIWCQRVAIC